MPDTDTSTAAATAVPVDFRITTYWKRRRGEAGLTSMASRRLVLSETLDWILSELPDGAVTIEHDETGSNVAIRICWDLVPAEIRYGKRQP